MRNDERATRKRSPPIYLLDQRTNDIGQDHGRLGTSISIDIGASSSQRGLKMPMRSVDVKGRVRRR